MTFEDMLKNFDQIDVCHLSADCFLNEISKSNKVN